MITFRNKRFDLLTPHRSHGCGDFFYLILYIPSTISQLYRDGSSWVEPVLSYDKCILLKDHNTVTPVRLEAAALRCLVKHSTTEPLRSLKLWRNSRIFACMVFYASFNMHEKKKTTFWPNPRGQGCNVMANYLLAYYCMLHSLWYATWPYSWKVDFWHGATHYVHPGDPLAFKTKILLELFHTYCYSVCMKKYWQLI